MLKYIEKLELSYGIKCISVMQELYPKSTLDQIIPIMIMGIEQGFLNSHVMLNNQIDTFKNDVRNTTSLSQFKIR